MVPDTLYPIKCQTRYIRVAGEDMATSEPFAALFKMQTDTTGPDRKTRKNEHPAVAYSGDNWRGDVSKPAVLTFTPPENAGVESTVLNLTGSGVSQFTFNRPGLWTVTLEMHDGTVHTAKMSGLTVYVR